MALFLVTGGCGFIGSNLAHRLVQQGHRVRLLDDLSTGRLANVETLLAEPSSRAELVRGDIGDVELLDRALVGVDFVLHHAAVPSVPWSVELPLDCQRINVDGTLRVLDAVRRAGRVQRLVFAASCSAYGDLSPEQPKRETDPVSPQSPYAAAKLACEHLCTAYYHSYGVPTVALRYFNVFGPRQDPATLYAAVIPRFVDAALQGVPASIYGDGGQTRDFCFVDNVVQANLLACQAPIDRVGGQVFNIGCGEATSLLQLQALLATLIAERDQQTLPSVRFAPARAGEVRHSRADIGKARELLGYTPQISLRHGLEQTLAWARAQRDSAKGRAPCAA
jgi:UDP-glucose 4-epimerase